jgi:glutaredoxin
MTDWVIIYSSNQAYKCNFVKALLEEYNIPYQEVNKIDSAVVTVGEVQIYVPVANQIFARLIITQNHLD